MGHPYHHALSSVKKWGGTADDYLPLHQWFDKFEGDQRRFSSPRPAPPRRGYLHACYMDMQACLDVPLDGGGRPGSP